MSIIPDSKIHNAVSLIYNNDSHAQKLKYDELISSLIKVLPHTPKEPSLSSPTYKEDLKEYNDEIKKIKEELKVKYKEYSKHLPGDNDNEATTEEKKAKLDEIVASLSKIDHEIMRAYASKKTFGTGNVRIGKEFSHSVSEFLVEVVSEIFKNGIQVLKNHDHKTLQNKHVFGHIKENNYYPIYQRLEIVKRFEQEASKEISNDRARIKNNKEKASYSKKKKAEPDTSFSKPNPLYQETVGYIVEKPPIKFFGPITRLWESVKEEGFMISRDVKLSLEVFVFELLINLIKSTKKVLDHEGSVTFKGKHFYFILSIYSQLGVSNIDSFINNNKIDNNKGKNNKGELTNGNSESNLKGTPRKKADI